MSEEKFLRLIELERSQGNTIGEVAALKALKAFRETQVPEAPKVSAVDFSGVSPQARSFLESARSDVPMNERVQAFRANIEKGMPEQVALEQSAFGFGSTSEALGQFGRGIAATPETVLSIGSGMVAEPVAGLTGLAVSGIPGLQTGAGAGTVKAARDMLTFQPRTDVGKGGLKEFQESAGTFLQPIQKGIRRAGEVATEATGSPLVGTAVETGLSAIPEVVGLRKFAKKPSKIPQSIKESKTVKKARKATEATGIELFEGQQTLSRPALERQSFVQQLPSGVDKASKALEKQNIQASRAVDDLLAKIAPDEAIITGPERFRGAAQRAVEAKKISRKEKTSPIYNEAFDDARASNLEIDVSNIKKDFSDIAKDFPEKGKIRASINKALDLLDSGDLKRLHGAKMELDDLINSRADDALGATSRREVVAIKSQLLERMAEASPKYDAARAKFSELSKPVEAIENSIIGKVAEFDDVNLKSISRRIFDPAETNPQVVKNARMIINKVEPEAWNNLMRAEIERRMGSMKSDIGGGIDNIPSQLQRAIFGNKRSTDILLSGADKSTAKALNNLNTALKRASRGRATGSQTATRTEISKELRGGLTSGIRELFSRPVDTIVRVGEDAQFDARVSAMADALFDPKYQAKTTKLINSGRGKELVEFILSVEAAKQGARPEKEEEKQEE